MSAREKFAEALRQILLSKIAADKLVMPNISHLAISLFHSLRGSELNLKQVAAKVEQDPTLAALVLKIANSPLFRRAHPAQTVLQAINNLGISNVKNALITASARAMFSSKDPPINSTMKLFWEHSLGVGMVARDVAQSVGSKVDETCYLAGLLHDVGKPVVAAYMLEFEKAMGGGEKSWIDANDFVIVIQELHRIVGQAIVGKWRLPEEVAQIIKQGTDYDAENWSSTSNVVRFCDALVRQMGIYAGSFDTDANNSLVMIGKSLLRLDDDALNGITHGLQDRINELTTAA